MSEAARHLIWVLAGVAGLWAGTLLTLRGAVRMSRTSASVQALAGTLVLGVGTNLPELAVGIAGAARLLDGTEASGIVLGSAAGSAVTQIALVLGLAGMIGSAVHRAGAALRAGLPLVLAALLTAALSLDGVLGRGDGILLLSAFVIHVAVVLVRGGSLGGHGTEPVDYGLLPGIVLLGCGALVAGLAAHAAVSHAVPLAQAAGVSQTLIGVLILGLGSSLPELVLAVGAALGGRPALAIGSAFGNATFDLLVPLGAGAILHPLVVTSDSLRLDLPALVVAAGLALVAIPHSDGTAPTPRDRRRAAGLVGFYVLFVVVRMAAG